MNLALKNYYLNTMGITQWLRREAHSNVQHLEPEPVNIPITWHHHQDQSQIIFLAENQDELLNAIIPACAQNKTYSQGKLLIEIKSAQDFIAAFPYSCTHILIFGINQAKLMDATFTKPGIYSLGSVKICVTYTLPELAKQPEYKRELWQAWKSII